MRYYSRMCSLILLLTLVACSSDNHNHPNNITGKQLFEAHCVACHTPTGTGLLLLGVPSNVDSKLSYSQIINKIRHGQEPNSKMPIFKSMPEQEAKKIVNYLRQLARQ